MVGRRAATTCTVAILSPALVDATVIRPSIAYDELSCAVSGIVMNWHHDISEDLQVGIGRSERFSLTFL